MENKYKLPNQANLDIISKLAYIAIVITAPFAIYNVLNQNYLLGFSASAITANFGFIAWSITKHQTYHPQIILWIFAPLLTIIIALAINLLGFTGILWSYPAILGAYFMLTEKKAYLFNILFLLIIIPIIWINTENFIAIRATASLLLTSIITGLFTNRINKQQRELQNLATKDSLTSLYNRTTLEDTLEQAIEQNHRTGIPMSIAILDLDKFKNINDQYGHDQGDRTLKLISEVLQKRFRKVDKVFRLGGEEFLVLLYNTDKQSGLFIAEEVRALIENTSIDGINITASIGVASIIENDNWQNWIKRADEKQYQAKLLGGNRIAA